MIEMIFTSLLLLAIGMPALTVVTEWSRIRGNRLFFILTLTYCAFAFNELVFLIAGSSFYFSHVIIDCILLTIVTTAYSNVAYSTGNRKKIWIILVNVGLAVILLVSIIIRVNQPSFEMRGAMITIAIFGMVNGFNTIRAAGKNGGLFAPIFAFWILSHFGLYDQYPLLNRFLTICFYASAAISIGRIISLFHAEILNENHMLGRARDIIISMLNEISSSEEHIRSVEHMLGTILETIVQTLHIEGTTIFLLDNLNPSKPVLRFTQTSGIIWPFFLHDASLHGPLRREALETLVFAPGEGLVGLAAESPKPIVIAGETQQERMLELGMDPTKVRNILAMPILIKNELLGVVIAQNLEKSLTFSTEDIFFLQSIADQAASYISNVRMYAELAKVDRLRQEMRIATDIQISLLPKELPSSDRLNIASFIKPAREVGGDYYNFIHHATGELGIIIGDVSGKGLPASMIVVIAHTALGIVTKDQTDTRKIITRFCKEMYSKMNRGQFMTLNYLLWNETSRTLTYTGAGHENILLHRKSTGVTEKIKAGGMAIGLIEDPSILVKQSLIQTSPGDVFVLYTDGITDARNQHNELFALPRLMQVVSEHANLGDPTAINNAIIQRIGEFSGDVEQYDDMTLLVFCVR